MSLRRAISALVALCAAVVMLGACTEVDDALGSDLIPENQRMTIRIDTLRNLETYIAQSDSVKSRIKGSGYAYIGQLRNDTFGLRRCSFISQILPTQLPYRAGFGIDPIFDSVIFTYSISDYKGDTMAAQKFYVYEVNRKFVPEDSTFYVNFDAEGYVNPEPLFEFEITSPTKTSSRAYPTEAGLDYIKRLMQTDTVTYYNDTLWVNKFHGLYVVPEQTDSESKVIYRTETSYTGLELWLRDHDSIDNNLILDTIVASYACYATDAKMGNIAANMVYHDYEGSLVADLGVNDTLAGDPVQRTIYVEGMGGVMGYVKVTDQFVEKLAELGDEAKNGGYSTVSINQAMAYFPLTVNVKDPAERPAAIPFLDAAPTRLGMYTAFASLTGIPDYDHEYEESLSNYGDQYKLPYGGELNRSRGCYAMDVTAYIQRMWNEYQRADGNLDEVKYRSIFVAPAADDMFTIGQVALQGNDAIEIVLTYTLMR
ncbi:MAG: DUF4270 family protein [Rikenellaceae bacterium]|nr:DUF4270 family protein [Rikenellaceae bacterium]MBQ8746235.1 DUF4270 family protein [Rikenellaceae bacterium]